MKTKKELNALPAKLSEPWRNIAKGEQIKGAKNPHEIVNPKFKIAGYVRLSPTGDEREERNFGKLWMGDKRNIAA